MAESKQIEIKGREERMTPTRLRARFLFATLLLALYLTCIVMAIAPLEQLAEHPVAGQLPGTVLRPLGLWLPLRLVLLFSSVLPFLDKADLTFHFLVFMLFLLYGAMLWLAWGWATTARQRRQLLGLVGLTLLVCGGILVVAPGMLSHDIFVYAGYGRVMVAHGANPYFVPLSAFPNDPLASLDDWKTAVAAYGPLWLLICAALSWLLGANAVAYVLAFRLLALAAHLLNMGLIVLILRALGRSERVITVGGILYGLNPLMLIESALGAHNDVVMMTCLLLGCWCCADAEGARLERARYWLPALAFMLSAALIKFTALLGWVLFVCLLLMRTLQREGGQGFFPAWRRCWRPVLARLLLALGCGLGLGGLAYFPFWFGHSPHEIVFSLIAPPSTSRELGQFSILRAIQEWRHYHPQPLPGVRGALLAVLGQRSTWNIVQGLALLVTLGGALGLLWRRPQLQRWAVGSLLTMGAIFLVTPWFFPWYLAWLVALAPLAFPLYERSPALEYALQVFVLVFSLSAFAIYLSRGYLPANGGWIGWMGLSAVAPPSLAFGLAWLGCWWQARRHGDGGGKGGLLLRSSGS
uniref:DUF2029 domain-containing protein n=1 Tax=Thermogemmatispora argillosa TaxID=2045280 RepID=A0A455SYB9_9CHLR|nr:hypothetical protein KTA_08790 [Thermogemmatispora argillosa]